MKKKKNIFKLTAKLFRKTEKLTTKMTICSKRKSRGREESQKPQRKTNLTKRQSSSTLSLKLTTNGDKEGRTRRRRRIMKSNHLSAIPFSSSSYITLIPRCLLALSLASLTLLVGYYLQYEVGR